MSTLEAKPNKVSTLNTKLLPIAAILLLVLALLFMATPLLRGGAAFTAGAGANRQFNGQQFVPGVGNGTSAPGGQNVFPGQGGGTTGQGFPDQGGTGTGRTFTNRPGGSLLGLGLLSGITGTIVYAILLLVSLAAALGMFLARRWGQVLGIILAVVYLLLGLVSLLPMLLLGCMRSLNALSLGLGIVHLVLAIAVIVLAVLPAKKVLAQVVPSAPPTPPADST
jgi:hypothetical protein